jgi:hypothetical protein
MQFKRRFFTPARSFEQRLRMDKTHSCRPWCNITQCWCTSFAFREESVRQGRCSQDIDFIPANPLYHRIGGMIVNGLEIFRLYSICKNARIRV